MIIIDYTEGMVEGEPGPNLYWRGSPQDYLRLLNDLHSLGQKNNVQIDIKRFEYISLNGINNIIAKSSKNGTILCQLTGNEIVIDLDCSLWREIFINFLMISFIPSHAYVEFDDLQLREDANFIASSEW
jgi:hypothetical protein